MEAFFHWSCRSRVHPSNFIKKDFITELFLHGSCVITHFKLFRVFQRDFFAKHFLTTLEAINLQVTTLLKITCLTKYIELPFNFKSDLYCVKDYSYIDMPIPMSMPILICIPRFPSGRFPGFCQFRMEKKELALDMKYFNAYQAFWRDFQSQQDKSYVLLGINLNFYRNYWEICSNSWRLKALYCHCEAFHLR